MFAAQYRLKRQSGAVLAISLIMLLLLTLVGVTAMQGTSLEEKMSGNVRNKNLAFQAAETTLNFARRTIGVSAGPFNNTHGFYAVGVAPTPPVRSNAFWATAANYYDPETEPATTPPFPVIPGIADMPHYIIEDRGCRPPATGLCPGHRLYRITARAMSSSGMVILQATYRPS